MRTLVIKALLWVVNRLINSPLVADVVHEQLPKGFKYDVYGRCLRDFITRTEIDSEGELDLLLESLYTIRYGYCDSIRVCAAYLDKDFGTKVFTNKVNDVCGFPSTPQPHLDNPMD